MDWKKKVQEALLRTEFMAISTLNPDGSTWTNPVQYGADQALNLYFLSKDSSRHIQNLRRDGRISIAIYKTERFPDGEVLGLQLAGNASPVTEHDEVIEASKCYYQKDYEAKAVNHVGPEAEWKFWKVTPVEVGCFDSREFGEERKSIPLSELIGV